MELSVSAWTLVFPLAALVGGWLLRQRIARRRFERTNSAGVQEFASYKDMKIVEGRESCLGCFGGLLIAAGLAFGMLLLIASCAT